MLICIKVLRYKKILPSGPRWFIGQIQLRQGTDIKNSAE